MDNYVTYIIPVYNPTEQLMGTIQSVQNDYPCAKVMLIDDYSTENFDIFCQAKNIGAIVKQNLFQKGISGALNTGICSADTKFLARLDCGDTNVAGRTSLQLELFERNEGLDLVIGGMQICFLTKQKFMAPRVSRINNIITPFSKMPHPTWMIRRSSIRKLYRMDAIRDEDYVFLIENDFETGVINQPLVDYDANDELDFYKETRSCIHKSTNYIRHSKFKPLAIGVGLFYIMIRLLRLSLSRRKAPFN